MMVADDWVKSAMTDGGVVAELLLRLKEAKVAPAALLANPAVSALRWGIRQPRSRSPRFDGVSHRKEVDSAKNSRCSPSTPLSWSGGCGGSGGGGGSSPSANADAFEATSRQTCGSSAVGSRSKVLITDDSTNGGTRKLRRKKTFAELKEEENNLLKERICLEKEIASLRASFKEQGAENKNLKKMKLDLNFRGEEPCVVDDSEKEKSGHPHQRESTYHDQNQQPRNVSANGNTKMDDHSETEKMNSSFLLPDLNMMPSEDDSSLSMEKTLYGIIS